jgi:NTP pyrophosphatase (non-canonical NTP hydrolase)
MNSRKGADSMSKLDFSNLNSMAEIVHRLNKRWWLDIVTGKPCERNVGEMLMLVVSELAEALEGHRKSLRDAHIPNRISFEVELADAVIRILDIAGALGLDLGGAVADKLEYNASRLDHTTEARLKPDGKKY